MKREEWEKTTGKKFIKERRKVRRDETKKRAQSAYHHAIAALGAYVPLTESRFTHHASARQSDNAALSAILKFGCRFLPLYEAAQRELERRYEATQHGREVERIHETMCMGVTDERKIEQRRKELKRAYKRRMKG